MKIHHYAAMIMASLSAAAQAGSASDGKVEYEKCYGVARAGKNDCASRAGKNSCAGRAVNDAEAHQWVYVPRGLCEKLANGEVES